MNAISWPKIDMAGGELTRGKHAITLCLTSSPGKNDTGYKPDQRLLWRAADEAIA